MNRRRLLANNVEDMKKQLTWGNSSHTVSITCPYIPNTSKPDISSYTLDSFNGRRAKASVPNSVKDISQFSGFSSFDDFCSKYDCVYYTTSYSGTTNTVTSISNPSLTYASNLAIYTGGKSGPTLLYKGPAVLVGGAPSVGPNGTRTALCPDGSAYIVLQSPFADSNNGAAYPVYVWSDCDRISVHYTGSASSQSVTITIYGNDSTSGSTYSASSGMYPVCLMSGIKIT